MKKLILPFLLAPFCALPLTAAEDCAKNLDACAGGKKSASPFVEASLREAAPPAPVKNPAPAPAAAKSAAPAARAAAQPAEAPAAAAAPPAAPADGKEPLSNPLWLLFVGGVLAAVYLYLAAGRRKGRKK